MAGFFVFAAGPVAGARSAPWLCGDATAMLRGKRPLLTGC